MRENARRIVSLHAAGGSRVHLVKVRQEGYSVWVDMKDGSELWVDAPSLADLRAEVHTRDVGVRRTIALLAIDAAEHVDQLGEV